jgi:hypothetical protein
MESRPLIGRSRISPSWLFVLPAVLVGASLDRGPGSAQAPCPVGQSAEVHYSPGEDLEKIDLALIREAAKQIDMVPMCSRTAPSLRLCARRPRAV